MNIWVTKEDHEREARLKRDLFGAEEVVVSAVLRGIPVYCLDAKGRTRCPDGADGMPLPSGRKINRD